jgi:hypothetical protein
MFLKICPASIPNISLISGQEWFRIIEYLVLRSASGVRDQIGCGFGLEEGVGTGGAEDEEAVAWAKEGAGPEAVLSDEARGAAPGAGIVEPCFFFFPRLLTVVQVSPKGFPARDGNSSREGIGMLERGRRPMKDEGAGLLRVAMGGSENWTFEAGLGCGAGAGVKLEGSVRVRKSLTNT